MTQYRTEREQAQERPVRSALEFAARQIARRPSAPAVVELVSHLAEIAFPLALFLRDVRLFRPKLFPALIRKRSDNLKRNALAPLRDSVLKRHLTEKIDSDVCQGVFDRPQIIWHRHSFSRLEIIYRLAGDIRSFR